MIVIASSLRDVVLSRSAQCHDRAKSVHQEEAVHSTLISPQSLDPGLVRGGGVLNYNLIPLASLESVPSMNMLM